MLRSTMKKRPLLVAGALDTVRTLSVRHYQSRTARHRANPIPRTHFMAVDTKRVQAVFMEAVEAGDPKREDSSAC
jgi:hypothetical protein